MPTESSKGAVEAFSYLRVSSAGQVDGDGFDRQRAAITRYAQQRELSIVEEFRDEGVSGTIAGEDRPAWARLLVALESNGVGTVIVERLDRLARDVMVQESMIRGLLASGFELISTYEPDLCSDDPTRKLIRVVLGAMAEYEKQMIVQKLRVARDRKRERDGRCEGRIPFPQDEHEREILEVIKSRSEQGIKPTAIAAQLDYMGLKPRYGEKWHHETISRIIRREKQNERERMDVIA